METEIKMLTPSETEKLPRCKRSHWGKCSFKNPDVAACIRCMTEGCFTALTHEDLASATEALHCVVDMLKEAKVI